MKRMWWKVMLPLGYYMQYGVKWKCVRLTRDAWDLAGLLLQLLLLVRRLTMTISSRALAPALRQHSTTPSEELQQYLQTSSPSSETINIASWPALKALLLRLNTPLPASATAERLFSCAGLTMNRRRWTMTDELFENLVWSRRMECCGPRWWQWHDRWLMAVSRLRSADVLHWSFNFSLLSYAWTADLFLLFFIIDMLELFA